MYCNESLRVEQGADVLHRMIFPGTLRRAHPRVATAVGIIEREILRPMSPSVELNVLA